MITKFSKFRRSGALLSFLGALLLIGGIANAWILSHTHTAVDTSSFGTNFTPVGTTTKYYVGYQAAGSGGGTSSIRLGGTDVVACSASNGNASCNGGYLSTTATHEFFSFAHIFSAPPAKANAWYGTTAPSYCPNGNGD